MKKLIVLIILLTGCAFLDPQPDVEDMNFALAGFITVDKFGKKDAATFIIKETGHYEFFIDAIYSGSWQKNEMFYIQLRDGNFIRFSNKRNAGNWWVVTDPGENYLVENLFAGKWKLFAGRKYSVDLVHFSTIAADYPQFLTGEMGRAESVHFRNLRVHFRNR